MKKFIKGCISEIGILGTLLAVVACVVFFPFFLVILLFACVGYFNEWSMTWFESEGEEDENERRTG